MPVKEMGTQLLGANLSVMSYNLLAKDAIWTAGLAVHDWAQRDLLVSVGREMAGILADITRWLPQFAHRLEEYDLEALLFQAGYGQQWAETLPDDWAAELADLFPLLVTVMLEFGPQEQERLRGKADRMERGEWPEGDLLPPLDCACLGIGAVVSLACIPLSAGFAGGSAVAFAVGFFSGGCATQLRNRFKRPKPA